MFCYIPYFKTSNSIQKLIIQNTTCIEHNLNNNNKLYFASSVRAKCASVSLSTVAEYNDISVTPRLNICRNQI